MPRKSFLFALLALGFCSIGNAQEQIFRDAFKDADHHVIVRVVYVTEEWMPFDKLGVWDRHVSLKESEHVKYFDVAIWEHNQSVHLYDFGNDYDYYYGASSPNTTAEQRIAYRESFRIFQYTNLPFCTELFDPCFERSPVLRDAFKGVADKIIELHPNSVHHLMYSGHGGPGGNLFEGQLKRPEVAEFLQHWTEQLGRNLGIIDMGGPCNKGGWSDLKGFCEYADYYIASDLPNGGYAFDDWTIEKYNETQTELAYHTLFADPFKTIGEVASDSRDIKRKRYEYARQDMINKQLMQANYVYSCQNAQNIRTAVDNLLGAEHKSTHGDLYQVLQAKGANQQLLDAFQNIIAHKADNRDFFQWPTEHNGISDN